MSGNRIGGLKAAQSNKTKFGENFYARIGKIGGAKGHTGGFYGDYERARVAGTRGGRTSTRAVDKAPLAVRREQVKAYEEFFKDDWVVSFGDGFHKKSLWGKIRERFLK